MGHLNFLDAPVPVTLSALSAACGAAVPSGVDPSRLFRPIWPLNRAGHEDAAFFFDIEDVDDLVATLAGACVVSPQHLANVPAGTIPLVTSDPLDAFRRLIVDLQTASTGSSVFGHMAIVHPSASLEQAVSIEAGTVVGPRTEIGAATVIGANSVIGAGVRIGRGSRLESQVSICHALIGDRVRIEAGARIGMCSSWFVKSRPDAIPRLGRVIIQDEVEIGANAVVERGFVHDTMIGDRARIGALALVAGGRVIDRCTNLGAGTFSSEGKIG